MFYNAGCITKLCEALKGSAMTLLKCAASAESSLFCQCALSLCPTHPLHSIGRNYIRDEGASALAAVLMETQITTLGWAATRYI